MSTQPVAVDTELNSQALTTVERATMMVVNDNESRAMAAELGVGIAGLYKRAVEWFEPMKRSAHDTHAKICSQEKAIIEPLEKAKKYLSTQIGTYDSAQERIRRAEEVRQQEEARKVAEEDARRASEEQAIEDAIRLEAAGDKVGADAVLAHPVPQEVYVPPVVVARSVPKTKGVSGSTRWTFCVPVSDRCQNAPPDHNTEECPKCLAEVPREYLILNTTLVGQVVRATKGMATIPGVKVAPEGGARFKA